MGVSDTVQLQVRVVTGQYRGIGLRFIDTPGLTMSGSSLTGNARILHGIKKALKKHRPDLVLYVDRQDVVRTFGSVEYVPCGEACILWLLNRFGATFCTASRNRPDLVPDGDCQNVWSEPLRQACLMYVMPAGTPPHGAAVNCGQHHAHPGAGDLVHELYHAAGNPLKEHPEILVKAA